MWVKDDQKICDEYKTGDRFWTKCLMKGFGREIKYPKINFKAETLNGLEQKNANATSLAVIILTAIAGTIRSSGNNLINWQIVLFTGIPAAIISYFAADYLKNLSNIFLTRLFAILIIVVGIYTLLNSFKKIA